jgi:hypothetical protein
MKKANLNIGWIITANGNPVFISKEGKFYLGGSPSLVGIALFENRKEAIKIRARLRKKHGIAWGRLYTEQVWAAKKTMVEAEVSK